MSAVKALELKFLPSDFKVTTWEAIKPYAEDVLNRAIHSVADMVKLLEDDNEIQAVLSSDYAWRYIQKSRFTSDEAINAHYNDFLENIDEPFDLYSNEVSQKIVTSPYAKQVEIPGFAALIKRMENDNQNFREENLPLSSKISKNSNKTNSLRGAMSVVLDGQKLTMQEAGNHIFLNDRGKRQQAWQAKSDRYSQDKNEMGILFSEMFEMRQQQAKNAGYENYRDYRFSLLNRTDYTPEDCYRFHESIKQNVVPLLGSMQIKRKQQLGVDTLHPWDLAVDIYNRPALKLFSTEEEFIGKTHKVLRDTDVSFGDTMLRLQQYGYVDLMSRPNKQPGGYNYPLPREGISFIQMNATGNTRDMETAIHEVGHANHQPLMSHITLSSLRSYPSEVAELASMTMELITMDNWHHFFNSKEDLLRTQGDHLEGILETLPWLSLVDEFQHNIYLQNDSRIEAMDEIWVETIKPYATGQVEKPDNLYGHFERNYWMQQNHIFGMPFYYIDYGIAQKGALEVWKNYKENPAQALGQYKQALSLGYTKSMSEIYQTAGTSLDFSNEKIKQVVEFVGNEMMTIRQLEMVEYQKNHPRPI